MNCFNFQCFGLLACTLLGRFVGASVHHFYFKVYLFDDAPVHCQMHLYGLAFVVYAVLSAPQFYVAIVASMSCCILFGGPCAKPSSRVNELLFVACQSMLS